MDFFSQDNTIISLIGVIIGASSWIVKKAFNAHSDLISKEIEEVKSDVSSASHDIKDAMGRLYSIEKEISVQKAETSGLFERLEDIIKSYRSDFDRYETRIENLERYVFVRNRSSKKREEKNGN